MRTVLYVYGLHAHADSALLEEAFSRHGKVLSVQLFRVPDMLSRHGGFGIVQMGSHTEAKISMAKLNGAIACGSTIAVRWATAAEQTTAGHPRMFGSMNLTDAKDVKPCH